MASHKAALRTQIKTALAALTPAQVMTQSAAVLSHLLGLPSFANCRSASVFLPMERGGEVDTWPIVRELLSRGASVAIPRVTGREPEDMVMLRLEGLAQAEGLPRTKWGIPEPNADVAATMADVTGSSELTLLLVPGVAFDARCGRVGHGRGYYDAFISRQRGLERPAGAEVLVVGLALAPQIVDAVPMGEDDERLDMVVTPDGVLAYTSAADQAKAAELLANSKRQRGDGAGGGAEPGRVGGDPGRADPGRLTASRASLSALSVATRTDAEVVDVLYTCGLTFPRGDASMKRSCVSELTSRGSMSSTSLST